MKQFQVVIDCDNAAFERNSNEEIIRILRDIISKLRQGHDSGSLFDVNGNKVGEWLRQ